METEEKINKKESFTPTSDMFYIYFRFYNNTSEEISEFKSRIKDQNSFILGLTESFGDFDGVQVNVYVKEEDLDRLKNENTLELYQNYVGDKGHKVE